MKKILLCILAGCFLMISAGAQSLQDARLGRGLVATGAGNGAHVSWRMLPGDKPDLSFDLYRETDGGRAVKLNKQPIRTTSDFLDGEADLSRTNHWILKSGGKELASFTLKGGESHPYLEIPVQKPEARQVYRVTERFYGATDRENPGDASDRYTFNAGDCSAADLDGDGQLEIILKWEPSNASVPSRTGITGNTLLDAYKLDGTLLWRIDLGHNVRSTYLTTPFVVYDLDRDGRAELVCKTAEGTVDGQGTILGNPRADWRSMDEASATFGRIVNGPEYLTVFDGRTGQALDSQKYIPIRYPLNGWGGIGGNDSVDIRPEHYTAGVAYLDGRRPSVFFVRGADGRTVVAAWDFRDGKLQSRWTFDSSEKPWGAYSGNGSPQVAVADFDGDGCDEICVGAMTVDNDGKGLYTTRLRGGPVLHAGAFLPGRKGLQVFGLHDTSGEIGAFLGTPALAVFDGATGEVLWSFGPGETAERALAADIDPRHPGAEIWVGVVPQPVRQGPGRAGGPPPGAAPGGMPGMPPGAGPGMPPGMGPGGNPAGRGAPARTATPAYDGPLRGLYAADGQKLGDNAPAPCHFTIYWDADPQAELIDGTSICKWDWTEQKTKTLLEAEGVRANESPRGIPCLVGDLLGDWREEVVWISEDGSSLRIYCTPIPADGRTTTLLDDRMYRLGLVSQNVGYNGPAHLSFDLTTRIKP